MDLIVARNVKNGCCQIFFTINKINYIGSGWFYTASSKVFFVTAAHCAIAVSCTTYYKMTKGFIENPMGPKKWQPIDINKIYVDGIADIAVIETNIPPDPAYCLTLAEPSNAPSAGDICYIVGNPGGSDEDSICVGTVI